MKKLMLLSVILLGGQVCWGMSGLGRYAGRPEDVLLGASISNDFSTVFNLIEDGIDINLQRELEHKTALIWAAYYLNEEAMKGLLARGAAVNMQDQLGFTALMWVIEMGVSRSIYDSTSKEISKNMIQLLLDYGADVNIMSNDGETAATFARRAGWLDVVSLLEEYDPSLNSDE